MTKIQFVSKQLDLNRKQKMLQADNSSAIKRNAKEFKKRYAEAVPFQGNVFEKIFGGMFAGLK